MDLPPIPDPSRHLHNRILTPGRLHWHTEETMHPISPETQVAFEEAPGITGVKSLSGEFRLATVVCSDAFSLGVAVTIPIWETLLTTKHEIRLVWCRPFTGVKFGVRYPVIGCQLVQSFVLSGLYYGHEPDAVSTSRLTQIISPFKPFTIVSIAIRALVADYE
ncbi:hypothetical protein DENSPDRAFT_62449 [Dentipellis sp. KUC8613]|nr:hypothetical protein DENSPDRAFT_62449 [Dentipellis sp. KUC8613]